jgi:hypothetical protein
VQAAQFVFQGVAAAAAAGEAGGEDHAVVGEGGGRDAVTATAWRKASRTMGPVTRGQALTCRA